MNNIIFRFLIAVMAVWLMSSCSSTEGVTAQYPYISSLANTNCLSHIDTDNDFSRGSDATGIFEMTVDGTTAHCKFTSLDYPCDFEKVNISVTYSEGVMTLVEYPSSNSADCRCETDATFIIKNIPENEFILQIYHGDINGEINKDAPKFIGKVQPTNGSLTIPY